MHRGPPRQSSAGAARDEWSATITFHQTGAWGGVIWGVNHLGVGPEGHPLAAISGVAAYL